MPTPQSSAFTGPAAHTPTAPWPAGASSGSGSTTSLSGNLSNSRIDEQVGGQFSPGDDGDGLDQRHDNSTVQQVNIGTVRIPGGQHYATVDYSLALSISGSYDTPSVFTGNRPLGSASIQLVGPITYTVLQIQFNAAGTVLFTSDYASQYGAAHPIVTPLNNGSPIPAGDYAVVISAGGVSNIDYSNVQSTYDLTTSIVGSMSLSFDVPPISVLPPRSSDYLATCRTLTAPWPSVFSTDDTHTLITGNLVNSVTQENPGSNSTHVLRINLGRIRVPNDGYQHHVTLNYSLSAGISAMMDSPVVLNGSGPIGGLYIVLKRASDPNGGQYNLLLMTFDASGNVQPSTAFCPDTIGSSHPTTSELRCASSSTSTPLPVTPDTYDVILVGAQVTNINFPTALSHTYSFTTNINMGVSLDFDFPQIAAPRSSQYCR